MFSRLTRVLVNASVRLKLALGFGQVLILSFLIAATGWQALSAVLYRSDSLTVLGHLAVEAEAMRADRIVYRTLMDSNSLHKMNQRIEQIDQYLTGLSSRLRAATDRQWLEEAALLVSGSKAALVQLPPLLAAREQIRPALKKSALQASDTLAQLASDLPDQNDEKALDAIENLRQAMEQAEDRAQSPAWAAVTLKAYANAFDQSLDELQAALASVTALPVDSTLLKTDLANYREQLLKLEQAQLDTETVQNSLEQQLNELRDKSNLLSQSQNARRNNEADQTRTLLISVTVAALALGTLAAWWIARQIAAPLREILGAAHRVAEGDLSHDMAVDRRDELGQLQQSIGQMTGSLRSLISSIGDSARQIAGAATQLSTVTEQTRSGLNEQKDETDQVATAMNEMLATAQEVARHAERASVAAQEADHQAGAGEQVVTQAVEQIGNLASEMALSGRAMLALQQESQKIASVLDVIKSVSQQTNLLALNAAIEAARAGEQGRGFAVVADEVRSLAGRTSASTQEIASMVGSIQQNTREAVISMEEGVAQVDKGMAVTAEVERAIREILQATLSTTELVNDISRTISEQSLASNEIAHQVERIAGMSESNSRVIGETASTTDELSSLAGKLSQSVDRFRL